IAGHGANAIIEAQYEEAERAWRIALATVAEARAVRQRAKPTRITEQEANLYAANLVEHLYDGDIELRRIFLASVVKRIVVFDDEGTIELVDRPATQALRALRGGNRRASPRYAGNHLTRDAPLGVPDFIAISRLHPSSIALAVNNRDNN